MKVIAKQNKRSVSKELEWLIEKHIEEYEKKHGEMKTSRTITTDKEKSFSEKTKEAFKLGLEKSNS